MKRKLLLAAAVTASLFNGIQASSSGPVPTPPPAPEGETQHNQQQTPPKPTWRDRLGGYWESTRKGASQFGSDVAYGTFGYGMEDAQALPPLAGDAGRMARGKRKLDEFFGSKPAKIARTTGASLIGAAGLGTAGFDTFSSVKRGYSAVGYKFATLVMGYNEEDAMAFAKKASTKVIAPVLSIILPYLLQSAIRPGQSYMRQGGAWVGSKASGLFKTEKPAGTGDDHQ